MDIALIQNFKKSIVIAGSFHRLGQ